MTSIKPMKRIMIALSILGLISAVLFHFYTRLVVGDAVATKPSSLLVCLAIGYIFGLCGFILVKTILKNIDKYYKGILEDKLKITYINSMAKGEKDLILKMKIEFEKLLEIFARFKESEYRRLRELSITDYLTGLYNHRHFYEYLDERKSNNGKQISLLFCDLDHFKQINDKHGHDVGDLILKEVGRILKEAVGEKGEVFRYGGEEFVIIVENIVLDEVNSIADDIRCSVENNISIKRYNKGKSVTMSIGIASHANDEMNLENLIEMADKAMYFAKRNGRNQCKVYTTDLEKSDIDDESKHLLIKEMLNTSVYALTEAIDKRDSYKDKHSEEVTNIVLKFAEHMGLSRKDKEILKIGGLLHDCGKMGLPDQIINKTHKLSEKEWSIVKSHTLLGSEIIRYIIKTPEIETCVRNHHERWDGSGYPDGLKENAIPLYARIISIADAYHAMTSDRPYRRALSKERAINELRNNKGTQFDPQLVEEFVKYIGETVIVEVHSNEGSA